MSRAGAHRQEPAVSEHWSTWGLDAHAPFELVEATVAVRNAFADPASLGDDTNHAGYALGGRCREASDAHALGLNRVGWNARCMFASRYGDGHTVVLAGRWLLDPTAEQFGAEGPYVYSLSELPDPWYALEPEPDTTFAASEAALIGGLAGDFKELGSRTRRPLFSPQWTSCTSNRRSARRRGPTRRSSGPASAAPRRWVGTDTTASWCGGSWPISPLFAERANVTTVFEGLGFDPSRGGGDGGRRGLGCDRYSTLSWRSGP